MVVLDPAVGTGTFLLGAADQALVTLQGRGTADKRKLIRDHLIPHFYGFELLPAPYAIAHLKLRSFYEQAGSKLEDSERIQIFLSNTLEGRDKTGQQMPLLPMFRGIVEEGRSAGRVKFDTPVLVIVGNPPYDRTSHNSNAFSDRLQSDFFFVDGERIRDKNPGPLSDDYLRFIRWSVWKLLGDGAPGHGILAFVTNRAFIERVLHRGVRQFLLRSFDEIFIFDLHGDQREWYSDRIDQKVFKRVQAGISLVVFVKRPGTSSDLAEVRYRDQFGTRGEKLQTCLNASVDDPEWRTIAPRTPLWMLVPYEVAPEYDTWPSVDQLFPDKVSGVQTHRDQLVVAFTKSDLRARLRQFADPTVPDSFWEDQKVKKTRDWRLQEARAGLRTIPPKNLIRWTYRPFDRRWIAFDSRLVEFTRTEISPHLMDRDDNLALAFSYGSLTDGPYVLVSRRPIPAALLSWRTFGQAYFAPELMRNPVTKEWEPNLPNGLLNRLEEAGIRTTVRGLVEYVYAVLNAPAYRLKFAHGLRYGFARLPLTRDPEIFERLRKLGHELILLHLLEHEDLDRWAPTMEGNDRGIIDDPSYDESSQSIRLGPDLDARPVAPGVWDYQQGAYPVVRDFLRSRVDRRLSTEEFEDFRLLVAAVGRTLEILPDLDKMIGLIAGNAFTDSELGLGSDTRVDSEVEDVEEEEDD